MGRERRKNGKYKYANTRVVFELMHATKVSCNVVLLEIPNANCRVTENSVSTIKFYRVFLKIYER